MSNEVTVITYSDNLDTMVALVTDQSEENVERVVKGLALGFDLTETITLEREDVSSNMYFLRPSFDGMEDEQAFVVTTVEAT